MRKLIMGLLTALAIVAVPVHVEAQEPTVTPEQQQQLQLWFAELQQIQQQLAPVQAQALETPALQESYQALEQMVQAAVEEADPEFRSRIEQMQALEREAAAAREAGDEQKLQELAGTAQRIQSALAASQAKAMERPDVAERMEAFQKDLTTRMVELDPEVAPLLDRYQELQGKLASVLQPDPDA